VLRTFSKIFGLAGLRLGYAVATPGLIPYLQTVQEPFNLNRPALVAGLASLGRPDETAERRTATARARERLVRGLREAGLEPLPSAANFVLVRHGADDAELGDGLLRRGILVRSGASLGLPGWARITVGPEPLMDRVVAALPAVLTEVRRSGALT
jgi:histidinol-phosphate aminotransferase